MSSNPASIKITSRTAAKSTPAGKTKKSITRQQWMAVIAIVGFILLGYRAWKLIYKPHELGEGPPIDAPLSVLGPFVNSKDFDQLDFDRRRQLMGRLRKDYKDRSLLNAKSQLGENYATCVAMAWLAGQLDDADKYFKAKGVAEKNKVLDAIIKDDEDDRRRKEHPPAVPARPPRPGEAVKPVKPPLDAEDKPDKVLANALMENWPPEEKGRVLDFQAALKERKKQLERQARQQAAEKAAGEAGDGKADKSGKSDKDVKTGGAGKSDKK